MFLPLYDSNKIAHIAFPYVNYGLLIHDWSIVSSRATRGLNRPISNTTIPVVRDGRGPAPWLPDQVTPFPMFLHADLFTCSEHAVPLSGTMSRTLGHVGYLVFYLLCGVLAGLVHLFIYPDSYGPLVGASGAVAGVMGAYLVLYPRVRVFVLNRLVIFFPLALPAWAVLGIWIFSQLFYAVLGSDGAVAWWAHIGGAAAGAALVLVFRRFAPGPSIGG